MTDFADTPLSKFRQLNLPLGWAVLYVAGGLVAVGLQQPSSTTMLWYPAIAIGIACLLRTGLRYWPIVLAADFIVSLDQFGVGTDAAVVSACTTLEAALAVLIVRTRKRPFRISGYPDLAWLVLACVAATFLGASLGSSTLALLGEQDTFNWRAWLTWWTGDAASSVSLLPLILIVCEPTGTTDALRARTFGWEPIATLGSALAIAYLTFGYVPVLSEDLQEGIEPLIFGPVIWAAVRQGTRTTTVAILSTAIAVVLFHLWEDQLGLGSVGPDMLEIQCFLVALTIVGLSLSLALDRERHQRIEAQAQAAQLRQATDELSTASTRMTLAAKSANLGIWDWNLEDNSLVWDEQVYAMYQIDPNTRDRYETWLQRLHPDDRTRLLAEIDGSIARGEDVNSNFRIVLPDGDERYVNTHGIVQASEGGKATRIIGIDYDVTELVRQRLKAEASELQAASANRAKSEFLAIMSHELRTPLNAIIGFSDIIVREAFGPLQNERYADYVQDIRNSGQLLLSLINDILDLTRIEARKLDLNLEPIRPNEILSDIARLLAPLAQAKNLTLAVQQQDCPPVLADRRALRQLLNNLVSNGIKFTDANGAVTLSAEPLAGGRVALLVADNGRGIPRERIAELGKPFAQIQDSLRRDVGGLGLGLAISRSLAEAMGGSLAIDSDLGRGTIVRAILPAAELS